MKHTPITGSKTRKYGQSLLLFLLAGSSLLQAQDYLVNADHSYKILQLATNSQSNGTQIVLGDRNVGNSALDGQTLWIYDAPTKTIRLAANQNKCIHRGDVNVDGSILVLYDYIQGGHPNQEWVIEDHRIKLAANKLYCIGLGNPNVNASNNFNAGNPARLNAVDPTRDTYQKWIFRNKPNMILTADGQWRRIEAPGDTQLDVAIPDPCPFSYLTIRARGGDGGHRTVNNTLKAEGGQGVTVTATYKIGTGTNELRPGTNIRLVIGTAGQSWLNNANAFGAGGGGGSGVIYEAPGSRPTGFTYYPWEMCMVAGGGGGGVSDCCAVHYNGEPGNDNRYVIKNHKDEIDYHGYCDSWDGSGSGFAADDDPSGLSYNVKGNGKIGGFQYQDGYLFPLGGRSHDNTIADGGFGFGGGGMGSFTLSGGAGGGGGYSGGGWDPEGGAGGSSFIDWSKAIPGTGYMVKNNTTASPRNGYVEYQFSNTAPASRGHFEYGAQDIEILKSGAYTLKWQSDGNLVLYGPPGAIWTSGTNGRGKDLIFQSDGNMVIYEAGTALWSSKTPDGQHDGKGGRTLTLNAEGMLSIADVDNKTIWRPTGPKALRYNSFEYGLQDVELLKCGTYTLKWQGDGNLVLYGPSGAAWASYTNGHGNRISFQPDGNLVIYNNSTAVWTSDTADNQHGGNGGRQIMLTADGWLTILDKYWQTVGGWGYDAQP